MLTAFYNNETVDSKTLSGASKLQYCARRGERIFLQILSEGGLGLRDSRSEEMISLRNTTAVECISLSLREHEFDQGIKG